MRNSIEKSIATVMPDFVKWCEGFKYDWFGDPETLISKVKEILSEVITINDAVRLNERKHSERYQKMIDTVYTVYNWQSIGYRALAARMGIHPQTAKNLLIELRERAKIRQDNWERYLHGKFDQIETGKTQ